MDKDPTNQNLFLENLQTEKLAFLAFLAEGKFSSLHLALEFEQVHQAFEKVWKIYGDVSLFEQPIEALVRDSRLVKKEDVFYCERGQRYSGFDFLKEVLEKGVRRFVCLEKDLSMFWEALNGKNEVFALLVIPEAHFAPAFLSHYFTKKKAQQPLVWGFLGQGATTLAHVFYQFFKDLSAYAAFPQSLLLRDEMLLKWYKNHQEKHLAWTSPYLKAEALERLVLDFSSSMYQTDLCFFPLKSKDWKKGEANFLDVDTLFVKKTQENLSPLEEIEWLWLACQAQKVFVEDGHALLASLTYLREKLGKLPVQVVKNLPYESFPQSFAYGKELCFSWIGDMHARHFNFLQSFIKSSQTPFDFEDVVLNQEAFTRALAVKGKQERIFAEGFSEQHLQPYLLVDSAWNVEQVSTLLCSLKEALTTRQVYLLMGISGDRPKAQAKAMVDFLLQFLDKEAQLFLTLNHSRSENPEQVLEEVKEWVYQSPSFELKKEHIYFYASRKEAIKTLLQALDLKNKTFEEHKSPLLLLLGRGDEALFVEKQKVEYWTDAQFVKFCLKERKDVKPYAI